ncbi:MAG: OmpA family protein, partial [Candidatus Adiutrix sp.]
PCDGRIKEEAVGALLRKINQRIPSHPYQATLRVFGHKKSITRRDFTTTYFGPETYERDGFATALARLVAADSVSPFATAISAANHELDMMGTPKAVLMFSDFEESAASGTPAKNAEAARRHYGQDLSIFTFYVSRQTAAQVLAKSIAQAGGGRAYEICEMLNNPTAFENMMMGIFGPSDEPPCDDEDGDGVCDIRDLCPGTPPGAPVDERGCWIAAYSQFFDFDKAVVKSAFVPRIEHAAGILIKFPNLPTVTIAGHTDNVGDETYNLELGRRRAQAVMDLMVKFGVPTERMQVKSYGLNQPIADNGTEEGRSKNRRVEFHIGDLPL